MTTAEADTDCSAYYWIINGLILRIRYFVIDYFAD